MAQNTAQWLNAPILYLDTIDSTNNYAMQLIDADKAQPGMTVLTKAQTKGKGQRGKTWTDRSGESLLMSLITEPQLGLEHQFVFSATVATAIVKVLEMLYPKWQIHIKWPNDIIINDKKAGGILIENILRGSKWSYAVIGFGLNVLQKDFGPDLPTATSLYLASGELFEVDQLMHILRQEIIQQLTRPEATTTAMQTYNDYLYQKNAWQGFLHDERETYYLLKQVHGNGQLETVDGEGITHFFNHGELTWKW